MIPSVAVEERALARAVLSRRLLLSGLSRALGHFGCRLGAVGAFLRQRHGRGLRLRCRRRHGIRRCISGRRAAGSGSAGGTTTCCGTGCAGMDTATGGNGISRTWAARGATLRGVQCWPVRWAAGVIASCNIERRLGRFADRGSLLCRSAGGVWDAASSIAAMPPGIASACSCVKAGPRSSWRWPSREQPHSPPLAPASPGVGGARDANRLSGASSTGAPFCSDKSQRCAVEHDLHSTGILGRDGQVLQARGTIGIAGLKHPVEQQTLPRACTITRVGRWTRSVTRE